MRSICAGVALFARFLASVRAEDVTADDLGNLVTGRKWLVAVQGDLTFLGHAAYWDFNADGSMCVRLTGRNPNDPCADNGKWKLDHQILCWDLKFMGEQYGYKSACVRVQKVGEKKYEAYNVKAGYRQFVFKPVN